MCSTTRGWWPRDWSLVCSDCSVAGSAEVLWFGQWFWRTHRSRRPLFPAAFHLPVTFLMGLKKSFRRAIHVWWLYWFFSSLFSLPLCPSLSFQLSLSSHIIIPSWLECAYSCQLPLASCHSSIPRLIAAGNHFFKFGAEESLIYLTAVCGIWMFFGNCYGSICLNI